VDHESGASDGGSSTSTVALSNFTIVVNTRDGTDAVDQAELTLTLQNYLLAGIMEAYPSVVAVTLNGTPNEMDPSNGVDYTGYVVFSCSTAPPAEDMQALAQALLLDLTAVQAVVNENQAIGQDAQVEQVAVDGSGGEVDTSTSAVALTDFTIVVNTRDGTDPVNQAQLTTTLQDYLLTGIMKAIPSVVAVTLNSTPNEMDPTNAVDYTGYVVFSCSTAPPTEDVQALVQALLLDLTAVQAAVGRNPAIGQDAQVEQVAVGGFGGQAGTSTSAVALPAFTIVVNTSDDNGGLDQAQLTTTLQDYLAAGIREEYPNVVAVTLSGSPNQMDPSNAVDYTGYVVFSGTAPPAEDVQALVQDLLLDAAAVQAAVDGNPAIGEDAVVEEFTVGARVALSNFTVVLTSDDTDTVDESQLTETLKDYLLAGIMQDFPTAVGVMLDGNQTEIDGSNVFDYTGYAVFFDTAPPSTEDVESLERDLMLDLTDVQAAVDADSGIGQNVRVEQVLVGDDSAVALPDFTIVFTSDDSNAVNQAELARTLENYLMTGLMQDFPGVEAVVLQPQQSQQSDEIFFSGYALFSGLAPDFRDVQSSTRGLLRDRTALQAAVDSNPAIGGDISVSGVVLEGAVDDENNDRNRAAIIGGVVGAGALTLAMAIILISRRRNIPDFDDDDDDDDDDEGTPLAPPPPPLPSGDEGTPLTPAPPPPLSDFDDEDDDDEGTPLAPPPPPLPSGVASDS
jgi:hypothetical protein